MTKKKQAARGARGNMVQVDRKKTDVRVAPELMEMIEQVCLLTGQTKNSLFLLGAGYLCAVLSPLLPSRERDKARAMLRSHINAALASA